MRVATRRLRAALALFVDVLPVRAQLPGGVGLAGRLLGAVRDLDVQLEALPSMTSIASTWSACARPRPDPLAELHSFLEQEREAARTDLLAALDSLRWERLARGMASMVQQGPLADRRPPGSRPSSRYPGWSRPATTAVKKAARRAKRSGVVADFHRLRIRCKRLRYSLEFSAELYGGRTTRYVRQLAGLQDQLGLVQDSEVATARLVDLASGEAHLPATTVFVMGGVAERHRVERESSCANCPRSCHGSAGASGRSSPAHGTAPVRGHRPALPAAHAARPASAPDPERRQRPRPWKRAPGSAAGTTAGGAAGTPGGGPPPPPSG